ncbi:MAG: hypothetical protein DLM66_09055 [Candidatus Dormiibacter spiritus]|nr:MAG: hypothetical protein DLM66_09055 [Candidatus Dormibacteraeota bacterium]
MHRCRSTEGPGHPIVLALNAGREPKQIRRLLNLAPIDAPARQAAEDLARLALEDGIGTFIVMGDVSSRCSNPGRDMARIPAVPDAK